MPVVRLTQANHMQTKIKCAAILSRLSLHQQYYVQFETDPVLKVRNSIQHRQQLELYTVAVSFL